MTLFHFDAGFAVMGKRTNLCLRCQLHWRFLAKACASQLH